MILRSNPRVDLIQFIAIDPIHCSVNMNFITHLENMSQETCFHFLLNSYQRNDSGFIHSSNLSITQSSRESQIKFCD